MPLSLISLNIERAKHLDLVIPFLREAKPDIVCLQEVREPDIPRFQDALGAEAYFTPMAHHPSDGEPAVIGICIFSRIPFISKSTDFYHGDPARLPNATEKPEQITDDAVAASINCAVSFVEVEKNSALFKVGTTHFLWSREGKLSVHQNEAMTNLLAILQKRGEFVLTGDFNAPRGGEIFSMLASNYKDNIPLTYKTSIDASLHRAGKTHAEELADKMVDGLFSTPAFSVSDVNLVPGVSDHMAVIANITRPS